MFLSLAINYIFIEATSTSRDIWNGYSYFRYIIPFCSIAISFWVVKVIKIFINPSANKIIYAFVFCYLLFGLLFRIEENDKLSLGALVEISYIVAFVVGCLLITLFDFISKKNKIADFFIQCLIVNIFLSFIMLIAGSYHYGNSFMQLPGNYGFYNLIIEIKRFYTIFIEFNVLIGIYLVISLFAIEIIYMLFCVFYKMISFKKIAQK